MDENEWTHGGQVKKLVVGHVSSVHDKFAREVLLRPETYGNLSSGTTSDMKNLRAYHTLPLIANGFR